MSYFFRLTTDMLGKLTIVGDVDECAFSGAVSATAAFAYGVLPRLKLFLVGKAARQAVKTNLLGTEKEV